MTTCVSHPESVMPAPEPASIAPRGQRPADARHDGPRIASGVTMRHTIPSCRAGPGIHGAASVAPADARHGGCRDEPGMTKVV
ncbi:hypothetical protein ASG29_15545 [Sphingomonas sp. Leaf412]|nr:hypothetical protein ASG29_15545 [Sphingomonas sp. Leaf412]